MASKSKAMGGGWCHQLGAWSSALSEALCPLLSFFITHVSRFYSSKVPYVLLSSGDSKVVP